MCVCVCVCVPPPCVHPAAEEAARGTAHIDDVDTDEDEDETVEFEAWKLREMASIKRYRDAVEKQVREAEGGRRHTYAHRRTRTQTHTQLQLRPYGGARTHARARARRGLPLLH